MKSKYRYFENEGKGKRIGVQSAKTFNQRKGQKHQNWKDDKTKNNKIGNIQNEPRGKNPQSRNAPQTNAIESNRL